MSIVKKIAVRRRGLVIAFALLVAFTFAIHSAFNYDLQMMTSWNLNLNKNSQSSPNDTKEIRQLIKVFNNKQKIYNENVFGPIQNNSIVIVVQVHRRTTYLKHLIASLAEAKDISKTLLIFSHDFYDEEINELVQSIDFCKVMQIFYPFSIQTHPNEFPGTDPKDCKRDMKKEQALIAKCQNAHYPDLYGHYREASFTQMKHHWWWKLNRVFDQLEVTRYHTGLVLLLEDDYFVAPDFLHILKMLKRKSISHCPTCNIFSLGTYSETLSNDNYFEIEVTPWITSKHNMGMAFDRLTWIEIKSCAKHFCLYDDYNYDWSLQQINYSCLKDRLIAMVVGGPRIFHIGECGMHHNSSNCDSKHLVQKVKNLLENAADAGQLYPNGLTISKIYDEYDTSDTLKANGGWSDLRDIQLCLKTTLLTRV